MTTIDRVTPTQEVFKQWKKYNRLIWKLANRFCLDPFEKEEAYNESYIWMKQILDKLEDRPYKDIPPYIYTVLHSKFLRFSQNYLRQNVFTKSKAAKSYHSDYSPLEYIQDGEERFVSTGKNIDIDLDSYLVRQVIKKYIECMPRKMKEIYKIMFDDELNPRMTNTECAKLLGVSRQYIDDVKKRGYRFLRNHIESKNKWIKEYLGDL